MLLLPTVAAPCIPAVSGHFGLLDSHQLTLPPSDGAFMQEHEDEVAPVEDVRRAYLPKV